MIQPPGKHWVYPPALPAEIDGKLSGFPKILRQILVNRGITDPENAKNYLAALPPENSDPHNMLGVSEAVDRILHAVKRQEKIWEIDRLRCITCGACVDACPKKCLSMITVYSPSVTKRTVDSFVQEPPKNPAEPVSK